MIEMLFSDEKEMKAFISNIIEEEFYFQWKETTCTTRAITFPNHFVIGNKIWILKKELRKHRKNK